MISISKVVLCTILSIFSICSFATENLRVAVIFDKTTTAHTIEEQYDIATDQIKYLNQTMINSGLGNDIKFQLVVYKRINVMDGIFDNFDDIRDKYINVMESNFETREPSLTLNKVSRDSKVDIIITIIDPWGDNNILGKALLVPNRAGTPPVEDVLSFADAGIVFVHENHVTDPTVVSHEIGHTFGLWHGQAVQVYKGETGHFSTEDALDYRANGYGKKSGSGYGTIMTGYYLDEGKPSNSFSNPNRYDCGNGTEVCGNVISNATYVLKKYKSYYSQRRNFYNN